MCAAIILIICVSLFSFSAVRGMLTNITQKNMAIVLANSSQGRQFVKLFADIDILSLSFLGKEPYLESEGTRLTNVIRDVIQDESNKELKESLEQLSTDFKLFIRQCIAVNIVFEDRKKTHMAIHKMLEDLEKFIGNLLVEKTLNDEDTTFIEQLLILSVGYQEGLLETGKLFAELEPEYLFDHTDKNTSPIVTSIDDLILRLQTITVSVPIIAESCVDILSQLKTYRQIIYKYFDAYANLKRHKAALNKSQKGVLFKMGLLDDVVLKTTAALNKKIIKTIFTSSILVLTLTIMIVLSFYFMVAYLFKSMDIEIKNRISAEKSLETLNLELEERVNKRTHEFLEANALLEKKMSELKHAEKEIQENEAFLNAIIENIPNMIFVKDAQHLRFIRFNKAGEDLLGFSRDDMLGKNDYDFFPQDQADFFIQKDRKVLDQGVLLDIPDEPIQTRSQGSRILHTKKIPINDEDGNPQYLLGISEDITEDKRIESQQRMQAQIMNQIHDSVIAVDTDGVITSWNRGSEKLFLYAADEIIGRNIRILYPKDMHTILETEIIPHLIDHGNHEIEARLIRKDKEEFFGQVSLSVLRDKEGKLLGMIGYSIDITERKKAENKIKASLKEKEALLKEIHHRVKNNMQVVSSLLSLQSSTISNRKILEALMETEVRVQSMAFVHEILYQSEDLSQIRLQKYLDAMTNHIMHIYATPARPVDIEINARDIKMSIEQAVPCGLIVTELVTNSLKYGMTTDSLLQIRIRVNFEADTHIVMEITDNGPGLPEDFDLVHNKKLGLKIVTGLITEQLEGTYQVEENKGAHWIIRWPVA